MSLEKIEKEEKEYFKELRKSSKKQYKEQLANSRK